MKIGFDAKRAFHNKTGLGSYSRNIVRILCKNYSNQEYHLYTPSAEKPIGEFHEALNKDNVIVKEPIGFFNNLVKSYWRSTGILNQLNEDNIDIYHGLSNELPTGINDTEIQSIITVHDLIFLEHPEHYKKIDRVTYEHKARHGCQNANLIIAVSEQTKKDIIKHFDISPEKIKVVYQPCDPVFQKHPSPEAVKETLKKLKLPDNYILNVGTIEERKNSLRVVQSLSKLKASDIHLVIIGRKTSYFKKVEKAIIELGLSERVHIREGISNQQLAHVYSGSKVMIYPSQYEGFGIPIIEALYQKVPVITSTGGCFAEAAGPDSAFVDSNSIEELSNAINNILSTEEIRINMITKGFDYVQKFNDDIIASEIMKLYELCKK
ncbi:MAG: glycosyltransferase family 4 protein [Flavobacteriales bacterium]|nr:glycosyltransferase family 4 protein [Flavobacteriales bacterium]